MTLSYNGKSIFRQTTDLGYGKWNGSGDTHWRFGGLEINRLLDISPAKTRLFGIRRELQFGVQEPLPISARQGKEKLLYKEKGSWESSSKQGDHGFPLADALPGKIRNFSSSCWALTS